MLVCGMAAASRPLDLLHLLVFGFFLSCDASTSEQPKPTCSIRSERGLVRTGNVCSIKYYSFKGCDRLGSGDLDVEYSRGGGEDVKVVERPLNTANSFLDLSLTVRHHKTVLVEVSGIKFRGGRQCVTVEYPERPGLSMATLKVHGLPVPHGVYNITLVTHSQSSFIRSVKLGNNLGPSPGNYRWDAVKSRPKRVGDKSSHDLIEEQLAMGTHPTPNKEEKHCKGCYTFNHVYNNQTAVLQVYYTVKDTCHKECQHGSMRLFKHQNINNRADCEAIEKIDFNDLKKARNSRNVSSNPVDYENVDTGCYMIRLVPFLQVSTEDGDKLFWVKPAINITKMDEWNITFSLTPTPKNYSLNVRWREDPKYNFSSYKIRLWYNASQSISCQGSGKGVNVKLIPSNDYEYVSREKSGLEHTFYNLSSGWYCARLFPLDDRCRLGECQSRSSPAKELTDPTKKGEEPPTSNSTTLVVGVAVGVMLAGIIVACCVLRCYPRFGSIKMTYSKVTQQEILVENQPVLLVWTQYGPYGKEYQPVITAFKKVLQFYSHCKVYDYLDLLSLPEEHQHQLLVSPTAWVDNLLGDTSVKIIIVGTEGAKLRQDEGKRLDVSHDWTEDGNSQDSVLFPFLLRRLQDKPYLSGDYSRIFHVRFSDVSDHTTELEGIVSWTRYRLPEHLKDLTVSLHGRRPEGCNIKEPTTEMLQDLTAALATHPLYKSQNGHIVSLNLQDYSQKQSDIIDSSQSHNNIPDSSSSPLDTVNQKRGQFSSSID
ncbi:uncharacterized protein LOC121876794 isoform X2 [Homarus americanus]|uniref:uncharacterized protein LOC121876794 isoform X2 n=1 Tax=Homarus americanus TaxID=6706 RepID=UPI001C463F0D|nr:uncharacterized protein LOC121876794 isoform X2 [Homarus americanus]